MTPPGGNAIQPLNQTHSTIELDNDTNDWLEDEGAKQ